MDGRRTMMRDRRVTAIGLVGLMILMGCSAMRERRWSYCDFDKATLKPEGKEKIEAEVVAPMKEHPNLRALVEGHTDSIGSDAYNQRLSERRADAVRDYMVSRGIGTQRITTKGWGKSKPIVSNKTKEGRARNRRVEITEE